MQMSSSFSDHTLLKETMSTAWTSSIFYISSIISSTETLSSMTHPKTNFLIP